MRMEGLVGPQVASDGALQPPRLTKEGAVVVCELHGKYYEAVYRGNVFIGTSAVAGVKLPAYNATAQTFGLWNPLGSGKNAVPLSLTVSYVDTTGAAGGIVYSYLKPAGADIGTAAPISAWTTVAPLNANIGAGGNTVMKFAPGAATVTAPALLRSMGVSQLVTTATTNAIGQYTSREDFDGSLILPPGVAFFVCGNIALLSNFNVTLMWEEVPV